MAKRGVAGAAAAGEPIPLSRFGALVAQLESVVASARQKPPDALLCFDLLSELSSALDEAPKETIQLWQRKCEDALQSLLVFGACRPVRRLASSAMGRIIQKGDAISVYARASTLQGWLVDGKRADPMACAGAAQCLGEIYRLFGRKITAGLIETSNIVAKLMKYHEDFVRQDALLLLENALEGSGGGGSGAAYLEAFRIIMRGGISDKAYIVRVAAARCLKAFANIGGPGLGMAELDTSMSCCVKGLEDNVSAVRDSFAEALGAILALAVNPDAQVTKGGKKQNVSAKKFDDGLQKHLILPFLKANGANAKKLRIGLSLSWVFFLQMIHMKYGTLDSELQNYAVQVPSEFKDVLDNTVVAALSHSSANVRVEAALTLRALAEVDPTCVGGLVSYGITTLHALRETLSFDKGKNLNHELDSLHGQATVLASLVAISPKLLLGYPARLPKSVLELSKKMLNGFSRNPVAATAEREAGWLLLASLLASMPKEELEDQVFDVLLLWASPFTGNPESYLSQIQDWTSELRFVSPTTSGLHPESVSKMLVNQMLLCYGSIFACQDNTVKIRLLNNLDQCLKAGRKYSWYMLLVSNACVALLSGLKELLTLRGAQSLPTDIFSMVQSIFKCRGNGIIYFGYSNCELAVPFESVRFAQQLVLFAPQAVPVHSHVQSLVPTLYSRQVLAASVTRNTSEGLSSSGHDSVYSTDENDAHYGADEDNMISGPKQEQAHSSAPIVSQFSRRNKHLRYRTRVFAAECVSHVPIAVGTEPAHFDLLLARSAIAKGTYFSNDWLVLKLQDLVSLSYQFGMAVDPEFPGHILLEQFQAQFVSAIKMAISTASGPLLLEAGLELATKVMTSSVIGGDRVALNRLFLLISRPLSDIEDLFYPSFADWVVCKIKVRLLTAHAAVKCYTYQFLRAKENVPDEHQQLAPLLQNSSSLLGKYWVGALKDYMSISFGLHSKINHKPFLDGIESLLVSSKVHKYLDEVWALILQATAVDAAPLEFDANDSEDVHEHTFIAGRSMALTYADCSGASIVSLFLQCSDYVSLRCSTVSV
ncbi:hypothetical protein ACQ4PT_030980 [Festuca glaucescens]